MTEDLKHITEIIQAAARKAREETSVSPEPEVEQRLDWPIQCTLGPGLVYAALGIPSEFFTPLFAVSRVAGWTARILEYLKNNRIFRPRALYVGPFNKKIEARTLLK